MAASHCRITHFLSYCFDEEHGILKRAYLYFRIKHISIFSAVAELPDLEGLYRIQSKN